MVKIHELRATAHRFDGSEVGRFCARGVDVVYGGGVAVVVRQDEFGAAVAIEVGEGCGRGGGVGGDAVGGVAIECVCGFGGLSGVREGEPHEGCVGEVAAERFSEDEMVGAVGGDGVDAVVGCVWDDEEEAVSVLVA